MADRALSGGGVSVPIAVPGAAGYPGVGYSSDQQAGIVQNTGADWFGPGNPLAPVAPAEVKGRAWDIQPARNLNQRPRAYERIKFPDLRRLADGLDLLRIVIETRKDQVASLKWTVGPKDGEKPTDEQDKAATKIEEFFEEPQKGYDLQTWTRMLMEDLFVIDAPTIYPRKTKGQDLYELRVFDGATINVMTDDWGEIPRGNRPDGTPVPAYQQVLHGLAAVNYGADELIYRPRNKRAQGPFGFSPVEQIFVIVNIAIRRETWQLRFFSEGSQPDALIGTPADWTPDQVRSFQDWWDSVQLNESAGKRGVRFVPGEVAKSYVATKETELYGKAEEWMIRVICYAFSVSPLAFVSMMNRATSETSAEQAVEEGLEPIKAWFKSLIDFIINVHLKRPDLVLQWAEEAEVDQQTQSTIVINEAKAGIISIDEGRRIKGLDPLGGDYAKPMAFTPTNGYVPIATEDQISQSKQKIDALGPPPSATGPEGQVGGHGGAPGGATPKPSGEGPAGLGSSGTGKGGAAKKIAVSPDLAKSAAAAMVPGRKIGRVSQKAIAKAAAEALRHTGEKVVAEVTARLRHAQKVAKADDQGNIEEDAAPALTAAEIAKLVNGLDLSSLAEMVDATDDALFDLAADSAVKALAMVGVRSTDELTNVVNQRAAKFAKDRAAELVGKRWTADGTLIDNPRAEYAITEATRNELRDLITKGITDNIGTPKIAESIQNAYAFSEERAGVIAHYEIRNANEQGKLVGWREAQKNGVAMKKSWLTSGDENVCPICEANEAQGAIELDADFESGDDAAPAHVKCECAILPEVEESGADDTAEE